MKVLCTKDYHGSATLCGEYSTEKHFPIHLIKDTYYDVLPTLGGYIINYKQEISFFKNKEWFVQHFMSINCISNINTFEKYKVQIKNGFWNTTKYFKESMIKDYNKFLSINEHSINKLIEFGVLKTDVNSCRDNNIGKSNYSHKIIQPWAIWMEYNLNSWDADIIKRVLRTKEEANMTPEEARKMDYEKIIHICQERIRQLDIKIQNNKK